MCLVMEICDDGGDEWGCRNAKVWLTLGAVAVVAVAILCRSFRSLA